MPQTEVFSGSHVTWTQEGQTMQGRVIQLLPSRDLTKAAGEADPEQLAHVRVTPNGVDSDTIQVLRTGDLTPLIETTDRLVKTAEPADLDALLAGLTEQERSLLATAWFAGNGPKLPNRIIGEEGSRTPLDGVDQATGGTSA